jgi:primosomal protein N' (replication factor Y)
MQPPKICPECNAGYIKFSGAGVEKIESELSRIFPQARIKILDDKNLNAPDADITIATSSVIKQADFDFDLIGVLGIDNILNRVDFRATEKAFGLLAGLMGLTHKKFLVQTSSPTHHCFQALLKKDANFFYAEELKQRKQLAFPPYKHLAIVKLRGKKEDKVKETAGLLFGKLKEESLGKNIEIISVNPSSPAKLRNNFCWQVLIRSSSALAISVFLKNSLKGLRHSGIIVTVDVDPI